MKGKIFSGNIWIGLFGYYTKQAAKVWENGTWDMLMRTYEKELLRNFPEHQVKRMKRTHALQFRPVQQDNASIQMLLLCALGLAQSTHYIYEMAVSVTDAEGMWQWSGKQKAGWESGKERWKEKRWRYSMCRGLALWSTSPWVCSITLVHTRISPGVSGSLKSSTTYSSCSLSVPSSTEIPEPWGEGCDKGILFRLHTWKSFSLWPQCSCGSLCAFPSTAKRKLRARVGQYTDLWVEQVSLWVLLLLCPFIRLILLGFPLSLFNLRFLSH